MTEKVIILDFGSQYTQLIARRVREHNVFCEIYPFNKFAELDKSDVKGVILSGSPFSCLDKEAPEVDLSSILDHFPTLAICYGAQYIAQRLGGSVVKSEKREYGKAKLIKEIDDEVLSGVQDHSQVWMSHGDSIAALPENFELIARTEGIPVAMYRSKPDAFNYPVYGMQFHPEVYHTTQGSRIIENFLRKVAGCHAEWTAAHFIDETVDRLKEQIGDDKVIMGLSGGVDSTIAATLLHRAIGANLHCVFIDNGLLRKDEFAQVLNSYEHMGLNIKGVNAADRFLDALEGTSDPEKKRKIIGRVFIEVFQEEAALLPNAKWLGQGTIYPDVIESVSVHGPSVTIKSHHNVGGLPDILHLQIVEPLRMLFKDEVRNVGRELRVPETLVGRHPFPGPGLAIRVLGEITREKVRLCQEADAIFINNLRKHNLYDKVWQAGAILLPVQSVGVMGDERTYESTVALRCVNSVDGMTAEWSDLPRDVLALTSSEIINNVKGINRVVYDISTKPPATIEWE